MNARSPVPPFVLETARLKVQAAEDVWNSRDPERVAIAYTEDTEWRNRTEFLRGRTEVVEFLRRKWARELDYRLKKTLWAFTGDRIAVRFEYEYHDQPASGFVPTATRTGSSTRTATWPAALRASTTSSSVSRTASFAGNALQSSDET